MKNRVPPVVALIVAVSCWSLSPSLISTSQIGLPPSIVGLAAVCMGAMVYVAVEMMRGRSFRKHVANIRSENKLGLAALIGIGAFVVYPMFYFAAIQSGDPLTANIINYLWPILGVLIAVMRTSGVRSLELFIALMFGFAGACVAFLYSRLSGVPSHLAEQATGTSAGVSMFLAALGAMTYATVSAFSPNRDLSHETSPQQDKSSSFFAVSLLIGGTVAALGLALLYAMDWWSLQAISLAPKPSISFVAYAILLPLAHRSWLRVVHDPRIPTFASIYLVPVLATVIMALWLGRELSPGIVSSLALVMCGIAFSIYKTRRIPVTLAVIIGGIASVLTSQSVARLGTTDTAASVGELSLLSQLLVAILAVFGGFVLTNAINRYNMLVLGIGRLYAILPSVPSADRDRASNYLHDVEVRLLHPPSDDGVPSDNGVEPADVQRTEAMALELLMESRVSHYEWLVLLIGAAGLIVALHVSPVADESIATVLLKATATAVTLGVLFAVRDYDLHRPGRLRHVLTRARSRIGVVHPPLPTPPSDVSETWYRVVIAGVLFISLIAASLNASLS